jgi:hypothetical protein
MALLEAAWLEWQIVALAALMVAMGFAAIAYMLGAFLSSEKMMAFAKLEFAEIIYSGILIISVLWILGMATGAVGVLITTIYPHDLGSTICSSTYDAYFGGDENFPCHMRVARVYLDTLYAEGKEFNYELLSAHMWYSMMQGFHLTGDFHEHATGTVNFSPLGSLFSLPSSVYSYMFEFGMRSMIIVRFQAFLLNFINYSLYPVLLMLGLILRTFPFARRIGGLLMAIGISLYFIFPMFYVVGGFMFENIRENVSCDDPDPNGYCPVITSLHFDPDSFYEGIDFIEEDPNGVSALEDFEPPDIGTEEFEYLYRGTNSYCGVDNMGWGGAGNMTAELLRSAVFAIDFTTLSSEVGPEGDYLDTILGPGGVIDATARFTFFSMFFALLSIFSTIGAIRSLSPIFGGDIELAGLTHLI